MLKVVSPTDKQFVAAHRAEVILFGKFCLTPSARTLTNDGAPVRLGDRALDILIALVERAGLVVSNSELFSIVWPNTYIAETNLRVQILALRKALNDGRLGARFIVSVRGRGYMFVARIESISGNEHIAALPWSTDVNRPDTGPSSAAEIDGSDEIVGEIVRRLLRERSISVRLGLTKYRMT
jgi:DNA-binding winged helix-turn-helix (wHTH) protein